MHKLSAFSHRNIDAGSPVNCCFFHDYVQMEKEERSFVRVEVWPLLGATASLTRTNWRVSY